MNRNDTIQYNTTPTPDEDILKRTYPSIYLGPINHHKVVSMSGFLIDVGHHHCYYHHRRLYYYYYYYYYY